MGGGGCGLIAIAGQNIPKGRINQSGWTLMTFGTDGVVPISDIGNIDGNYGLSLQFGGILSNNFNVNPLLMPTEAWNIDTKIDDGRPGRGKIVVQEVYDRPCFLLSDNSAGSHSATVTLQDIQYNFSNNLTVCALVFRQIL